MKFSELATGQKFKFFNSREITWVKCSSPPIVKFSLCVDELKPFDIKYISGDNPSVLTLQPVTKTVKKWVKKNFHDVKWGQEFRFILEQSALIIPNHTKINILDFRGEKVEQRPAFFNRQTGVSGTIYKDGMHFEDVYVEEETTETVEEWV